MRGAVEGGLQVLTLPDSNIYVKHVMLLALYKKFHGKAWKAYVSRSGARRDRVIRDHLGRKFRDGSIRIVDTVREETRRVAWVHVRQLHRQGKITLYEANRLKDAAWRVIDSVPPRLRCRDSEVFLGAVEGMYADIRTEPRHAELLEEWSRKKKGGVGGGSPGRHDMVILSTAAGLARSSPVSLLTGDNDFIVPRDLILRRFGVSVMDPWHLGGWGRP